MQCPECTSTHIRKNGKKRGKQNHIYWLKQVGHNLPDAYDPETIPQVGELDELEPFVGSKKTRSRYGERLSISKPEF